MQNDVPRSDAVTTESGPDVRRASLIAYAWTHEQLDKTDGWVTPQVFSASAHTAADQARRDRLPVVTDVDLAKLTVAVWACRVNRAVATPKSAGWPIDALVERIGIDLQVAHLLREREEARTEYVPRSDVLDETVLTACLLASLRTHTALDRGLREIDGGKAGPAGPDPAGVSTDARIATPAAWARATEAAIARAGDAVFTHDRLSFEEKEIWLAVDRGETDTRTRILGRLERLAGPRSRPASWEDQTVNRALQYLAGSMSRSAYRTEYPRLADSAARHTDAVAAGREPGSSTTDSARMLLADWSLSLDHASAQGCTFLSPAAVIAARGIREALGLQRWQHAEDGPARSDLHQAAVRDAVRLEVAFDRDTQLDRALYELNRTAEAEHPAVRTRRVGDADAAQGFSVPGSRIDDAPPANAWAMRRTWESQAGAAIEAAERALAAHQAHPPVRAPAMLYTMEGGREAQPAEEVAAFERTVGRPGERVVAVDSFLNRRDGVAAGTERVVTSVRVERWEDAPLSALYKFAGDRRTYHGQNYAPAAGVVEARENECVAPRRAPGRAFSALDGGLGR